MHLPACFASLILTFAPVFVQERTWRRAELLLIGAILAPGKRTVTSLLRIAGLGRVVGQFEFIPVASGIGAVFGFQPRREIGLVPGLAPRGSYAAGFCSGPRFKLTHYPDLRRHPRRRPAAVVARAGFAPVVAAVRHEETQPRPPRRHRLRALSGRLNGQSRANPTALYRP